MVLSQWALWLTFVCNSLLFFDGCYWFTCVIEFKFWFTSCGLCCESFTSDVCTYLGVVCMILMKLVVWCLSLCPTLFFLAFSVCGCFFVTIISTTRLFQISVILLEKLNFFTFLWNLHSFSHVYPPTIPFQQSLPVSMLYAPLNALIKSPFFNLQSLR